MTTVTIEVERKPMKQAVNPTPKKCSSWIFLALAGGLIWVGIFVGLRPSPFDTQWARLLLLLAPMVLVPLGLNLWEQIARTSPPIFCLIKNLQLPAAVLLAISEMQPQGWPAAVLAAPWLFATFTLAMVGLRDAFLGDRRVERLACDAALIYIAVGGAWALLDRLGWRPIDFDAVIVMLTAIHFHFAGFLLPLVVGLTAERVGGAVAKAACIGVVAGMPLVATGITGTKLGFSPVIETAAALWMAIAGMLAAISLFRAAMQPTAAPIVTFAWKVASLCLGISMLLAALYGLRHLLPIAWLDIPLMRVTHGTANALGFGLFATFGWTVEFNPELLRLTPASSTPNCLFRIE